MIELKLSQGAKPGHGGVLPGPKVTPRSPPRGVPWGGLRLAGRHSAFATPVEMMQFIERLRSCPAASPPASSCASATRGNGLRWSRPCWPPASRRTSSWSTAPRAAPAAPLEFTDHVGAPLQEGLLLVHNTLAGGNLRERIRIGCAGKIVSAFDIARMMALGADWCNSARGFMFALGCIQAQNCPPATADRRDQDPPAGAGGADKARAGVPFHQNTLEALKELVQAGLRAPERDHRAPHRAPGE